MNDEHDKEMLGENTSNLLYYIILYYIILYYIILYYIWSKLYEFSTLDEVAKEEEGVK